MTFTPSSAPMQAFYSTSSTTGDAEAARVTVLIRT
jgi:hypothetical protein